MAFPLTSLPPEIINSHVLMFLGAGDIISLSKCIPIDISKEVYDHAFPDNTHFPHYNLDMFKRRARATLYLVGDPESPYVEFEKDFPQHYEKVPNSSVRRMHSPWKIDVPGSIAQVMVGIPRVGIRTDSGDLYLSDMSVKSPYTTRKAKTRLRLKDNYAQGRSEVVRHNMIRKDSQHTSEFSTWIRSDPNLARRYARFLLPEFLVDEELKQPLPPVPQQLRRLSAEAFSEPLKPARLVDISDFGCYAVDSQDHLWAWKDNEIHGTRLCLREAGTGIFITGKISKLRRGCAYYIFIVEGVGLVQIHPVGRFTTGNANGIRAGYRCLDDHLCYRDAEIIPGTKDVSDYVATDFGLIYLNQNGQVAVVDQSHMYPEAADLIESFNKMAPFCRIYACNSRVVLETAAGLFVDIIAIETPMENGLMNREVRAKVLPRFKFNIASIAVSHSHCLALTTDGDVYTWGSEINFNGSMGLGRLAEAVAQEHVTISEYGLEADRPIKIGLPGKACALFGTEIRTVVLIDEEGECESVAKMRKVSTV